jgi:hypothetical protein
VYTRHTSWGKWEASGAFLKYSSKVKTIARSHSQPLEVFFKIVAQLREHLEKLFFDDESTGIPIESGPASEKSSASSAQGVLAVKAVEPQLIVLTKSWLTGHIDKFEVRAAHTLAHPEVLR